MDSNDSLIDTRQVTRDRFEPWMLGRIVEIRISTGRSWGGYLESYAVATNEWEWKLTEHNVRSQRRRAQNQGYSGGYGLPEEYTISITVIVPNNWDHYGVDGTELAR